MFHPVQIKHECMGVEDINSGGEINISNSTKYPPFIDEDVEYKYSELPQFFGHAQLSNGTCPKNEIGGQHNLFQAEENNTLAYTKNCVQNSTLFQVNQGESLNQMNPQCHAYMTQKAEQPQFPPNLQTVKIPNQMVTIPGPIAAIKHNRPGRPAKCSSDPNVGEKLKCQCEICFKEFGHKSNLFVHMRTHNGERPYKCTQCEKCFTHSGNLAIHMRTHSGERPYGCQICGKMFSHSGNLSTHLRTHSGVKPYKCNVCGKEFRHSGNLSIHERIHSGVKPFQCKICGKDFYHSGNLTTHMKKHAANIKSSITEYENNEKQTICAAPLNSFNNLSLAPTADIKLLPSANNIVPIKNECNDEELTNAVDIKPISI